MGHPAKTQSTSATQSLTRGARDPASVAEGWTPQDTSRHLDTTPRNITAALHRMRDRYNLPTNEAVIAAAVKLEWIPLAIDATDDGNHLRENL